MFPLCDPYKQVEATTVVEQVDVLCKKNVAELKEYAKNVHCGEAPQDICDVLFAPVELCGRVSANLEYITKKKVASRLVGKSEDMSSMLVRYILDETVLHFANSDNDEFLMERNTAFNHPGASSTGKTEAMTNKDKRPDAAVGCSACTDLGGGIRNVFGCFLTVEEKSNGSRAMIDVAEAQGCRYREIAYWHLARWLGPKAHSYGLVCAGNIWKFFLCTGADNKTVPVSHYVICQLDMSGEADRVKAATIVHNPGGAFEPFEGGFEPCCEAGTSE